MTVGTSSDQRSNILFYELNCRALTFFSSAVNFGFCRPVENNTCPTAFSMTDDPNLLFQGQDRGKLSFPAAAKLHNDVKPRILGYLTTLFKCNRFFFLFRWTCSFLSKHSKIIFYSKIIMYKDRKRHNYQATRVFGNRCLGEQGVCCYERLFS